MRQEAVDRVPVAPFGLGKLDPSSKIVQELISQTDPFLTTSIQGLDILGKLARWERSQQGDIATVVLKTPQGDLIRKVQTTAITSATVEYPFKELKDVDKFLSVPYEPYEVDASHFLKVREEYGQSCLLLAELGTAVCTPADWFGPEGFSLAWADAPDLVIKLTEEVARRLNVQVKQACQAGVDAWRLVGGEYVTVQLGPSAIEPLLIKPDKTLTEIIHSHNGIVYYHNHGPVMKHLKDFARVGIDFLDPLEAPPWGDVDLAEAKKIVGDSYCLVGNLDDMEQIERLSSEEVQRIARERLQSTGQRGFVLGGTASGTYTAKGAHNFMALVEVAREFAGG